MPISNLVEHMNHVAEDYSAEEGLNNVWSKEVFKPTSSFDGVAVLIVTIYNYILKFSTHKHTHLQCND